MAETETTSDEIFEALGRLFHVMADQAANPEVSRLADAGEVLMGEYATAVGIENLILKKKLKYLIEVVLPSAAAALKGNYKAHCELESITSDAMIAVTSAIEKFSQ